MIYMAKKKQIEENSTVNYGSEKGNAACKAIKVNIKSKTENQKLYWKHLKDKSKKIVICEGAAGCGKTFMSMAYALKALKDGEFENIKILIPTVEASSALKIGFLPGTYEEKVMPWKETTTYLIEKILRKSGVENPEGITKHLIKSKKVNFEIMSYIRGRNFDDTLLLLEESENLSPDEMLLAITRCGEGSKIVISGDARQSDRKYNSNVSGLEHAVKVLEGLEEVGIVKFEEDDVVRNDIITKILKIW